MYSPQYADGWALVVGINRYAHAPPLAIACADAESIAEVLVGDLGFPKKNVCVLLDDEATGTSIMERYLAFEKLSANDRLLVFFAGHGITVQGQRGPVGYLVPVDGLCDKKNTLIRWDELTRDAEIIPAKHILFIMDACYSGLAIPRTAGAGEKRFISEMLQRFSRQVITAGKADETVADGGGPTGNNSIFTGHLLEGLRGRASDNGVLTASYLMDYVYKKVATDPRSNQTPHFGHLEGDGDFILRTPNGEHLPGGPVGDFLVQSVVERPEPSPDLQLPALKPVFAERNGYSDPESDSFGRNGWSKKLGTYERNQGEAQIRRPTHWLSLVVEPVSNQPVNLDIADLARTLPNDTTKSDKPHEQFRIPGQAITTANSAILFEPHPWEDRGEECWNRFLRIQENGAIEYCQHLRVADIHATKPDVAGIKVFHYIQVIGIIWTFLYAARRILSSANYQGGVRYFVNLVGTKDSVLIQFSPEPGANGQIWIQPFDPEAMFSGAPVNWKCRDANLQTQFRLVIGSFGEGEAKKVIIECAEHLGLAYNHQSKPRCFNYGTDIFPWEQFSPVH